MKNPRLIITTLLHGTIMGIAEIVPGISASTATLLLGIYDDFIELLSGVTNFVHIFFEFFLQKRKKSEVINTFKNINFPYGIQLVIGMGIGIVLFSHIISYVYDRDEQLMNSIFFGIILASLTIPFKVIKKPSLADTVFFSIGFITFFSLLRINSGPESEQVPLWLVFFGGAISVTGMVLPGVNSSFLLIPLGIYEVVLNIITQFSKFNFQAEYIIQSIAFFTGLGFGLVSIVKILKIAFEKYLTNLFALIAGIMIASLAEIWPFDNHLISGRTFLPVILIVSSTIITFIFIKISKPEKEFKKST